MHRGKENSHPPYPQNRVHPPRNTCRTWNNRARGRWPARASSGARGGHPSRRARKAGSPPFPKKVKGPPSAVLNEAKKPENFGPDEETTPTNNGEEKKRIQQVRSRGMKVLGAWGNETGGRNAEPYRQQEEKRVPKDVQGPRGGRGAGEANQPPLGKKETRRHDRGAQRQTCTAGTNPNVKNRRASGGTLGALESGLCRAPLGTVPSSWEDSFCSRQVNDGKKKRQGKGLGHRGSSPQFRGREGRGIPEPYTMNQPGGDARSDNKRARKKIRPADTKRSSTKSDRVKPNIKEKKTRGERVQPRLRGKQSETQAVRKESQNSPEPTKRGGFRSQLKSIFDVKRDT